MKEDRLFKKLVIQLLLTILKQLITNSTVVNIKTAPILALAEEYIDKH